MKKNIISITLATALLSIFAAQASDFKGGYLGGKIGYNTNTPDTASTSNKTYPGVEVGYGWDMDRIMVGVAAFWDDHTKSVTESDYGADVKLGYPMDKLMPYIKLGLAGSDPGTRVHGGLGIEYKFAPQWSVAGEFTADSKSVNSVKNENSNISFGINYYFDKPFVAPAKVAVATAVEVKYSEPAVAPVSAPVTVPAPVAETAPAPKTIFTDKPITIEGASFDTGSAILKSAASMQLDAVVDFAAKYETATLTIIGYTDSLGNEKLNLQLSANRAKAVKAYLVKKGVEANRLVTSGKGSANPVGDNKTKEGRAQNRRVEINSVEKVAQ